MRCNFTDQKEIWNWHLIWQNLFYTKSKSTRNHIACNNAVPVLEGVECIIKHRAKEQKQNAREGGVGKEILKMAGVFVEKFFNDP